MKWQKRNWKRIFAVVPLKCSGCGVNALTRHKDRTIGWHLGFIASDILAWMPLPEPYREM